MKRLSVFLAVALFAALLGGCGAPPASSTDEDMFAWAGGSSAEAESGGVSEPAGASESESAPVSESDPLPDTPSIPDPAPASETRDALADDIRDSRRMLYGVGEPLWDDQQRGTKLDRVYPLIGTLGATSFRLWMQATSMLTAPDKTDTYRVYVQHGIIAELQTLGLEVIGMSHSWFQPDGYDNRGDLSAVPARDLTPGSDYLRWLGLYFVSWRTLAAEFPEIRIWEIGNEPNIDVFLHPAGYGADGDTFSFNEQALIAADMLYFGTQGVREANPDAVTVMSPIAATDGMQYGIVGLFLEKLYGCIESGEALGSGDPDDYFDAVSWHPYTSNTVDDAWRESSDAAYAVMTAHGDGDKPVLLTEFGYTDMDRQRDMDAIAERYETFFTLVRDELPYISGVQVFRLLNERGSSWGSEGERYFGLFDEQSRSFAAKPSAYALQSIFGGTGALPDPVEGK